MATRDENNRFIKGVSGNPAGTTAKRAATKRQIREILEMAAPSAALRLSDMINDPDPKIAMKVSCYVLDQVIGKAESGEAEQDGAPKTVRLEINGRAVRSIEAVDVEQEEEEAIQ